MTVVTISTIGYHEIIDLSAKPVGRGFTIFIAFLGIGTVAYMLSNFTAFIVEGDLRETFKRKKMEKIISNLHNHYIICGTGRVGFHIIKDLKAVQKHYVVIDSSHQTIEGILHTLPNLPYIQGDATDDAILIEAGIHRAKGIFAATDNDNWNLVISMTAKHLNPHIRVVTRCYEPKNVDKIKKAGADAVILPAFIGGLRMSSEMIKPTTVSFLDALTGNEDGNLLLEEIYVPNRFNGTSISDLDLARFPDTLLVTIKTPEGWIHNPPRNHIIKSDSIFIFMTTLQERKKLRHLLS